MIKIKICGLSRPEDMEAANEAMPDYIGFVFAESRRRVTFAQAERLRARLRREITPVGVFVGAKPEDILALYHAGVIELAQLHGGESEEEIARLPMPVIKAVLPHESRETGARFLLLDSGAGSGRPFDWSRIGHMEKPWFLAGGISPANIHKALECRPYAIDLSSGAETNGVKDRDKMIYFTRKVRDFI
ncbi:MAG: phosphoribosylanthranilate isomerase [Oscillospiraceae bacterium]|nr:phosphoribosylanthranilate isomerase [Oscillospiraceae bacterium]